MVTKWLTIPLALWCALAMGQSAVPTSRPHQNFVDNSGSPCALCTLSSFAAGTTTPQATYTDSTKTSQNTNPITLDVAGGANIWLDPALLYKFVLKDSLGTTLWTVDNVPGSGGGSGAVPCSTPFAVQIASSDATALACDSTITIDPNSHTLEVGGAITGPAFTLKNLSTITGSWTFDVSTPLTALNSLGPIPLGNLATQANDSVVMNETSGTAVPTAVPLPTGCTLGVNYSTVSHTWSCAATTIPLTNLANQAADTVVMNDTASSAAPVAVAMPTGCSLGVNYDTTAHAWACVGIAKVCTGSPSSPPYSCYVVRPDGAVEEWGNISVPASGTAFNSGSIAFPHTFPALPMVTITAIGEASFTGDPNSPPCAQLQTESTTGASVFMSRCIIAGAGGGNFDNAVVVSWHAIE